MSDQTAPTAHSIGGTIAALTFLPNRTPTTTDEQAADAFACLADYRDGGIFVGHWAGASEWERHPVGDEVVMVVDGETTMFFLTAGGEVSATLGAGELIIVPQGTWHRFETADSVKVMTITPQPTDHSVELPVFSAD